MTLDILEKNIEVWSQILILIFHWIVRVEQLTQRGCQLGLTFFGLTQEYKAEILKIMMTVAHYSKGAFSVMDLYQMPIYMRNFFIREFGKLKEEESKQIEKMSKR